MNPFLVKRCIIVDKIAEMYHNTINNTMKERRHIMLTVILEQKMSKLHLHIRYVAISFMYFVLYSGKKKLFLWMNNNTHSFKYTQNFGNCCFFFIEQKKKQLKQLNRQKREIPMYNSTIWYRITTTHLGFSFISVNGIFGWNSSGKKKPPSQEKEKKIESKWIHFS